MCDHVEPAPWCDQVSSLGDCPAGEIQNLSRLMGGWVGLETIIPSSNDNLVVHLGTPRPVSPESLHHGPPVLLPPAQAARGAGNTGVKLSDLPPVDNQIIEKT